jgi:hypothetical protein
VEDLETGWEETVLDLEEREAALAEAWAQGQVPDLAWVATQGAALALAQALLAVARAPAPEDHLLRQLPRQVVYLLGYYPWVERLREAERERSRLLTLEVDQPREECPRQRQEPKEDAAGTRC